MDKKREVIRLHVDLIQALLAPLSEADRTEIMVELAIVEAAELQKVSKLLDEQREETESWKKFNDQRLEDTYKAREMLKARPNETLPMAVKRNLNHACTLGMHQYPPGETVCTCGRTTV